MRYIIDIDIEGRGIGYQHCPMVHVAWEGLHLYLYFPSCAHVKMHIRILVHFQCGTASSSRLLLTTKINQALSAHTPSCLTDDCYLFTDARPVRLYSAETGMFLVGWTLTNFHDRTFSTSGPWVWNLSAIGPQTAGLVIEPFQTVAEDVFICQQNQSTVWIPHLTAL